MSINSVMAVAQSGLAFESRRMDTSANNVANVSTEGFRASRVTGVTQEGGGVRAEVQATNAGTNLVDETVTQVTAAASYKANAAVLKTADEMTGALLDTFA